MKNNKMSRSQRGEEKERVSDGELTCLYVFDFSAQHVWVNSML